MTINVIKRKRLNRTTTHLHERETIQVFFLTCVLRYSSIALMAESVNFTKSTDLLETGGVGEEGRVLGKDDKPYLTPSIRAIIIIIPASTRFQFLSS
jgi:hypothetical protein